MIVIVRTAIGFVCVVAILYWYHTQKLTVYTFIKSILKNSL